MTDRNTRCNNQVATSFCSILTLIFITLKLCGVIEWSWIWVLSPLWIEVSVLLTVFVVAIIAVVAYEYWKS